MLRRLLMRTLGALPFAGVASCISTRGPSVAETASAPAFRLASHLGGEVSLDDLLARGPAVVVFYRGHW